MVINQRLEIYVPRYKSKFIKQIALEFFIEQLTYSSR
jgi:hypothetical protein